MFFERSLLSDLNTRLSANDYRPVLICGVSGCGKTTLAGQFAIRFARSMLFDLSKPSDRQVFEKAPPGGLHFSDLFLFRNSDPNVGRTLLFLDNIHNAPGIWEMLVNLPNRPGNLFILGAIAVIDGRGQSAVRNPQSAVDVIQHPASSISLKPLSFSEFIMATGELEARSFYHETPCPDHAHEKLLSLFHRYVMTGGMPEAVAAWAEEHSMAAVEKVFGHILAGWDRLLRNQAIGKKSAELASSLLADSFPFAAAQVSFHRFANRPVRSREAANAFRFLEKLMFLKLIYPVTGSGPEAVPEIGRSPRLQFADTGMVIYLSGIRHQVAAASDLTGLFGGQVLRHVVGQEMGTRDEGRETMGEAFGIRNLEPGSGTAVSDQPSADNNSRPSSFVLHPSFWVNPKPQSHASTDFLLPHNGLLIPVVARTGEPGRLRSLHSFLDAAPHPFAVRLCADRLNVRKSETIKGKTFFLLSLPYYLAGRISEHFDGFVKYVTR